MMQFFSTVIHSFAQSFGENSIDGANQNLYLPRQIEPEAQRLNGLIQTVAIS